MSLHVNLLLETERRSGSLISWKFLLRIVAVFLAAALVLVLGGLFMGIRSAKQNRLFLERQQRQETPMYQSVVQLQKELKQVQGLMEILDGWHASRTDAYELLAELQTLVPASIQLTSLNYDERLEWMDNAPLRTARLFLKGRAVGGRAEPDVQQFVQALREKPALKALLNSVDVKRFGAAEAAASNVRVFEVECPFVPKKVRRPTRVGTDGKPLGQVAAPQKLM